MKNYTPQSERRRKSGGQALVLITFALIAMCGLIGLAVDLGWSYFVKKTAQAAADGAAQAAVQEAMSRVGGNVTVLCGVSNIECPDPTPANGDSFANTSNLYNGYQYAIQNGFSVGGHGGRQNVTMQANQVAGGGRLPPTAPGVNDVVYWVTVRTVEQIPQLFSAVLGNSTGLIAARGTAGIVRVVVPGSLYALNQMRDCINGCGIDVDVHGSTTITAPAGVVMGSECSGSGSPAPCDGEAGEGDGRGATFVTPQIRIHGSGTCDSAHLVLCPPGITSNGYTDPSLFEDPTKGKTQPPVVAPSGVKTCALLNGNITQAGSNPVVLGPFNYYAYKLDGNGNKIPTGDPITVNGNDIQFASNGTCPTGGSITGVTQSGSFPAYMFWGGVNVAAGSTVTFGPGQYVMVGSVHDSGGNSTSVFDWSGNNTVLKSSGSGPDYAGQMFIFTDPTYSGLAPQDTDGQLSAAGASLHFGSVSDKSGNTQTFSLNGYNPRASTAPTDVLSPDYNGFLFWQDRNNSTVKYNADGSFNCAAPYNGTDCAKTLSPSDSEVMELNSHANMAGTTGILYQPRGSLFNWHGGSNASGAFQVITGAIKAGGGGNLTLTSPSIPLVRTINALIE